MALVTFCVFIGIVVVIFPEEKKQQPQNAPASPIRLLHPRCLRLFFPFTHSHIYKFVRMKAVFPVPAFKIKRPSAPVYFAAMILRANLFNFLSTSSQPLLAWQSPPPLRATLSLGLEKRFLLLIMVVVADGQDGATFPVFYWCFCIAGSKCLSTVAVL